MALHFSEHSDDHAPPPGTRHRGGAKAKPNPRARRGAALMEARWSVEATGRTPALVMVAIASTIVVLLCGERPARALTLDQDDLFSVRVRAYSQVSIATQDSQKFVTDPPKFAGQV